MSTPTVEPPKDQKDPLFDEHVARIMQQTGEGLATILDPNKPPTQEPPIAPPPTPAPAPAPTPESPKQPDPAPAAAPQPQIVLKPKAAPTPVPPAPEPAKQPVVDEFEQSLTEDERDELNLARYAEKHLGKKGLADQYISYYKKVADYVKEHPDTDPDSEEFTKFINDNRPKWETGERRRTERQMIRDEAVEEAKKAVQSTVEPERQKLRAIEIEPEIKRVAKQVEDTLTTKDAQLPDMEVIDPDVVKVIREQGYEKALEVYDIEAPIVQGTINAATEWKKMTEGAVSFDEKNPTHRWLADFVTREEQRYLNDPRSVKVIDGRRFVPMHEYMKLQRDNPAEADKTWTMPDDMIGQAIINNGKVLYDRTVKHRKQAGWERKPKGKLKESTQPTPEPTPTPTPEPTPTPGSPKGGSRPIPGASESIPDNNPAIQQMPHLKNVLQAS